MENVREIMADLIAAAQAYRDQQAMPDSDNENRDRAIDRAERWLNRVNVEHVLDAVRYGIVVKDEDEDGWFHNGHRSDLPYDKCAAAGLIYEGETDGVWYLTSKGEERLLGGER